MTVEKLKKTFVNDFDTFVKKNNNYDIFLEKYLK